MHLWHNIIMYDIPTLQIIPSCIVHLSGFFCLLLLFCLYSAMSAYVYLFMKQVLNITNQECLCMYLLHKINILQKIHEFLICIVQYILFTSNNINKIHITINKINGDELKIYLRLLAIYMYNRANQKMQKAVYRFIFIAFCCYHKRESFV